MTAPGFAPDRPLGSIDRWAAAYVTSKDLGYKQAPPPPPAAFATSPQPLVIARPGRPDALTRIERTRRSVRRAKLAQPRYRAWLLHTFWHHELQAAELMCWAILAFPETPEEFRRGLVAICRDEIRHMHLYRHHIEALGYGIGAFPVRDWIFERVSTCRTPAQFVALMGVGLEGSNLDHTRRFAQWFVEVGDVEGARIQDRVGDEEVAHVRFALRWLAQFTGDAGFDTWRRQLVPPLTPTMFHGPDVDTERRRAAGFSAPFLADLEAWDPT